ncbi:CASP3-like protein [Mya arenaria]|uniref:CASP3-like protein n=1 Tax=Mya arenaria TaxID=6604 RepID=A0ABY7FT25_MYAAR|nr:caspase-3-like [Mya arenaria]WAR22361.1 CASP3-like protein [Mya arenaria]
MSNPDSSNDDTDGAVDYADDTDDTDALVYLTVDAEGIEQIHLVYEDLAPRSLDKSRMPIAGFSSGDVHCLNRPGGRRAILINNTNFSIAEPRYGSNVDESTFCHRLKNTLGFYVERYHDIRCTEMLDAFARFASRKDHATIDVFLAVVFSHGSDGRICGTDGEIHLSKLFAMFNEQNCPGLKGKPKVFIIQACRGEKKDSGVNVCVNYGKNKAVNFLRSTPGNHNVDALNDDNVEDDVHPNGDDNNTPTESFCYPNDNNRGDSYELFGDAPDAKGNNRDDIDAFHFLTDPEFLICFSSVAGYYSFRNKTNGSWFIQALNKSIDESPHRFDFLKTLTKANRILSYSSHFMSKSKDFKLAGNKQAASCMSTLTKDLIFVKV